jgi:hypothetical protein
MYVPCYGAFPGLYKHTTVEPRGSTLNQFHMVIRATFLQKLICDVPPVLRCICCGCDWLPGLGEARKKQFLRVEGADPICPSRSVAGGLR